jgi:hypothetical protein
MIFVIPLYKQNDMQDEIKTLQSEDIVAFDKIEGEEADFARRILNALKMPYLSRSDNFIRRLIDQLNLNDSAKKILEDGLTCHIITPRKQGAINGKIKLSLQFIPDENDDPQSPSPVSFDNPLDEIRNTISEYP